MESNEKGTNETYTLLLIHYANLLSLSQIFVYTDFPLTFCTNNVLFLLQKAKIAVLRQQKVNAVAFHSPKMERFTRVTLLMAVTSLCVQQ